MKITVHRSVFRMKVVHCTPVVTVSNYKIKKIVIKATVGRI